MTTKSWDAVIGLYFRDFVMKGTVARAIKSSIPK